MVLLSDILVSDQLKAFCLKVIKNWRREIWEWGYGASCVYSYHAV